LGLLGIQQLLVISVPQSPTADLEIKTVVAAEDTPAAGQCDIAVPQPQLIKEKENTSELLKTQYNSCWQQCWAI
jgi:hypothetical protein